MCQWAGLSSCLLLKVSDIIFSPSIFSRGHLTTNWWKQSFSIIALLKCFTMCSPRHNYSVYGPWCLSVNTERELRFVIFQKFLLAQIMGRGVLKKLQPRKGANFRGPFLLVEWAGRSNTRTHQAQENIISCLKEEKKLKEGGIETLTNTDFQLANEGSFYRKT